MQRKKSKTGKILLAVLGLFLVAGVAGTVTAGALTDWTFNFNDPFKDVRIEDQEFDYDGEAKTLNIFVPDGASYELTITDEEGKTVNECKDIGVYTFTYKVKIDNVTKEYVANLTIKDSSTIDSKIKAEGMRLNKANNYLEGNSSVQEITYTVEPEGVETELQVKSIEFAGDDSSEQDDDEWKSGKNASDYISVSIDDSNQIIKITNIDSKAFGSQIVVIVESAVNPDITASITCDFKCKKISFNNLEPFLGEFYKGINSFVIKYPYSGEEMFEQDFSNENRFVYLNSWWNEEDRENRILPEDFIVNTIPEKIELFVNNEVGTIDCVLPKEGFTFYLEIDENINPDYVILGSGYDLVASGTHQNFDLKRTITGLNTFMNYTEEFEQSSLSRYLANIFRNLNFWYNGNIINEVAFDKIVNDKPFKNEDPILSIPKEFINVHVGDWITLPYSEVFSSDDDPYLDFYIDLTPNISNVVLEDTSVTF